MMPSMSAARCLCALLVVFLISITYFFTSLLYPWRAIVPVSEDFCEVPIHKPIPKVIHRIWDRTEVPQRYVNYLETCKRFNPQYEHQMWNASSIEAFLKKHYPWGHRVYLNYPLTVNRYDAARYFIVHHYGGIYLDMDMNCSRGFDEIIASAPEWTEVILGEGFPVGIVSNVFAAKPESPFFHQVIHNLANAMNETFIVSLYETFLKTGPIFLWKNYMNFPCKKDVHILKKFKIRGEWLSHDGAATWQRGSGFYIMVFSNAWALIFNLLNYALFLAFSIFILIILFKCLFTKQTSSWMSKRLHLF